MAGPVEGCLYMGVFVGFPISRIAGRVAFIGAMIGGGLLVAGIAQAQAQPAPAPDPAAVFARTASGPDTGYPTLADRQAELAAAAGGPAPVQHLMMVAPERPAVETRADDVEDAAPDPAATPDAAAVPDQAAQPASAPPRR